MRKQELPTISGHRVWRRRTYSRIAVTAHKTLHAEPPGMARGFTLAVDEVSRIAPGPDFLL